MFVCINSMKTLIELKWASGSKVEHLSSEQKVAGSIPASLVLTFYFVELLTQGNHLLGWPGKTKWAGAINHWVREVKHQVLADSVGVKILTMWSIFIISRVAYLYKQAARSNGERRIKNTKREAGFPLYKFLHDLTLEVTMAVPDSMMLSFAVFILLGLHHSQQAAWNSHPASQPARRSKIMPHWKLIGVVLHLTIFLVVPAASKDDILVCTHRCHQDSRYTRRLAVDSHL